MMMGNGGMGGKGGGMMMGGKPGMGMQDEPDIAPKPGDLVEDENGPFVFGQDPARDQKYLAAIGAEEKSDPVMMGAAKRAMGGSDKKMPFGK